MAIIFDTFERGAYPENLSGSVSTSGHTWVVYQGTWRIYEGGSPLEGIAEATDAAGTNLAGFDFGTTDDVLSAKIETAAGSQSAGIFFRRTDNSNYYFAGDGALFRFGGAGGDATLATYTTGNLANRDWLRAQFTGSLLEVFVNGVLACSVTDTDHTTGTIHGLRSRFIGALDFAELNTEPPPAGGWAVGMVRMGAA